MAQTEEKSQSNEDVKNTIPLVKVSGVYFSTIHFKEESFLDTINFKPHPSDIFLVTYPKSGTTWVQYMLWAILNKSEEFPGLKDMMMKRIPFLEASGTKITEDLPTPRIMKTHLPFEKHPYHPEARYIYVARNAKDVCISYYHFVKQLDPNFKDGTIDDFFELYLEGKVSYGSWYDHVYSWYAHKDDPNVLILTYEWIKENHAEAVMKLGNFLGKQYKDELDQDPSLLKKIVEDTTFEAMKNIDVSFKSMDESAEANKEVDKDVITCKKKNESNDKEDKTQSEENTVKVEDINDKSKPVFFRKGQVGDWRNYLSESQERRLNEKLLSQEKIASVMTLWEDLWTVDELLNNC